LDFDLVLDLVLVLDQKPVNSWFQVEVEVEV
jgi:hypothetical protein